MVLPNFFIIGAIKAGTTSLHYYLNQHPEIFMSAMKEPTFFAPEFYTTHRNGILRGRAQRQAAMPLEEYTSLFNDVSQETAIGEASPSYLFFEQTPTRIKQMIPEAKIIAILRDPAERAFSAYCFQKRDGYELMSFEQALADEQKRLEQRWQPGWLYASCGYYYAQIKRYFNTFDPSQIRVYLQEELNTDSTSVCQDIFEFLGVHSAFVPDLSRKNISAMPKNQLLNLFLSNRNPIKLAIKPLLPKQLRQQVAGNIRKLNMADKPSLSPETRQSLIKIYREDVLKLQDLIQKDLSSWLIP
ncbi:MAG: sulfotransferase [Cyanobacteria bacterium RM1_2_2]|nr:sulfotransferase [Cyanobacteria bacterium RM1_2_2]